MKHEFIPDHDEDAIDLVTFSSIGPCAVKR